MTASDQTGRDRQGTTDATTSIDRRAVLKAAGETAVAVVAFSGTASAHNGKFFGCERVCSGTDGDYAVVAVDDGYECRTLEKAGPREDVPWDWDAHCYTAAGDEAVVGYVAEDEYETDEGCWLCLNPNDCAEVHYDDARAVRDALDASTCGLCDGEMNVSIGCEPATEPADDGGASPNSGPTAPRAEPSGSAEASADSSGGYPAVVRWLNRLLRAAAPGFRR